MPRTLSIVGTQRREPIQATKRLTKFLEETGTEPDGYGLVVELQKQVASILGKEAALLLPTGTMAQQIALRIHADRRGTPVFAAHPNCHLLNYEFDGYAVVHGLRAHRMGDQHRLPTTEDIRAISEQVSSVLWELPQRELGGLLPDWPALCTQVEIAKTRGSAAHLDGARLWEAAAGYGRSPAEIAAPFDTVYVSLYKSLEAPRGAVLAGNLDTIREAWRWAVRLGGDSSGNWPLAAFGLMALEQIIPRMDAYLCHAREIATAIAATGLVELAQTEPHTSLVHVFLAHPAEEVAAVHGTLAERHGFSLFRAPRAVAANRSMFEVAIGESAMDVTPAEVALFVTDLAEELNGRNLFKTEKEQDQ